MHTFGANKTFFLQQGYIKLTKSDTEDMYTATKDFNLK